MHLSNYILKIIILKDGVIFQQKIDSVFFLLIIDNQHLMCYN